MLIIHIEQYKKFKQADLQENLDSVFQQLKDIDKDLIHFQEAQNKFQEKLKFIDYSYLESDTKPKVTSFEDRLYQSIEKVKRIK